MRNSNSFLPRVGGLLAVMVPMVSIAFGTSALHAEGFTDSMVAGLAGMADLEPVADLEDGRIEAEEVAEVSPAAVKARSFARQSVPARDRASAYREGELFRNSKVAVPLLVADLEPRAAFGIRPLSGRSVGARPAAAWTKPATAAPVVEPRNDSSKRASATWSSVGQR